MRVVPYAFMVISTLACRDRPDEAQKSSDAAPAAAKTGEFAASLVIDTTKLKATPSGLRLIDVVIGTGPEAAAGRQVKVHYTGWLTDGMKFDSSRDRNEPFQFGLGEGQVIRGWDEGVTGMKVGGRRTLVIPAKLGYGDNGAPPAIPPGATLVFDIELLGVE